jgi:hypothetical protein
VDRQHRDQSPGRNGAGERVKRDGNENWIGLI